MNCPGCGEVMHTCSGCTDKAVGSALIHRWQDIYDSVGEKVWQTIDIQDTPDAAMWMWIATLLQQNQLGPELMKALEQCPQVRTIMKRARVVFTRKPGRPAKKQKTESDGESTDTP